MSDTGNGLSVYEIFLINEPEAEMISSSEPGINGRPESTEMNVEAGLGLIVNELTLLP